MTRDVHHRPRRRHQNCDKRRRRFGQMMRSPLRRRLFFFLGMAVFLTIAAAGTIAHLSNDSPFDDDLSSIQAYFSHQFAKTWDDPEERSALADETAEAFFVTIILEDAGGKRLSRHGIACKGPKWDLPIEDRDEKTRLGTLRVCAGEHAGNKGHTFILALVGAGVVLWLLAGLMAHKLTKPLIQLTDVTREIGEGRLSARARLGRHHRGEIGDLAHSINDMATRIERQLEGQRELLAGVSHEIRTPLARLRVLSEILRDKDVDEKSLSDIEREIAEIDDLTGQLLASSRLEFESIDEKELDARALVETSLDRTSVRQNKLEVSGEPRPLWGDATLIERALVNLIENAKRHGGGLERLQLRFDEREIVFCSLDHGPGFDENEVKSVFDPFYRGKHSGKGGSSLGLGLSLVRRIAQAHEGTCHAENRAEGGALVCFSVRDRLPPAG